MAIGTAAAIGLGVAGVGSVLSSRSQNKASSRAAQTSQANTDANVALARDIYGQNRNALNPFMQRGNVAGNQLNALLGLGGLQGGPEMMQMPMGPNAMTQFQPQQSAAQSWGLGEGLGMYGATNRADMFPNSFPASGGAVMGGNALAPTATATGAATPAGMTPQEAAQQAFDLFRQSSGFQNRFNSAMEGVTGAFSGIGGLQSGAAARALQDRAGQVAGDEFANYVAMLGGQQAVGAGAASSLAGVGQNFAGTVIGANNSNAQNQMAAQLGRQNPLANIAGILGGGAFSYGMGGR